MASSWKDFSLTHIIYPTNDPLAKLLAFLSLTPPFAVCALTTSTLIHKDVIAAYLLTGSLICVGGSALLKEAIKQPRPRRFDHDPMEEMEYGMPSNHSSFVWFGATWVVLYIIRGGNAWSARSLISRKWNDSEESCGVVDGNSRQLVWQFLHTQFTILTCLLIASGCAYSRVYLGYHTANQVVVGSVKGIVFGFVWYALFETRIVREGLVWADGMLFELERERFLNLSCDGSMRNEKKGM